MVPQLSILCQYFINFTHINSGFNFHNSCFDDVKTGEKLNPNTMNATLPTDIPIFGV